VSERRFIEQGAFPFVLFEPVNGDQWQSQVADSVEQPVQGGLVD
jgi:hypothetical protein